MTNKPPLPYVQNIRGHLYFRRAGFPRAKLPGQLLSPTFMAAYQQAMALTPVPIGASKVERGSVAHAVGNYFTSPQLTELAPGTQAMRRAILNRFRDQYGERPIGTMPAPWFAHVLAELRPHARRNWLKAIRALCQFAVAVELIKADPTAGMKLPKVKSERRRAWTPAEIEAYERTHPIGTKARLAFALGLCTLQRRGDAVRMGPQDVRDGMLAVTQEKTGAMLSLPVRPELRTILDATPITGLSTFLVTKSGKPYSGTDFDEALLVRRLGVALDLLQRHVPGPCRDLVRAGVRQDGAAGRPEPVEVAIRRQAGLIAPCPETARRQRPRQGVGGVGHLKAEEGAQTTASFIYPASQSRPPMRRQQGLAPFFAAARQPTKLRSGLRSPQAVACQQPLDIWSAHICRCSSRGDGNAALHKPPLPPYRPDAASAWPGPEGCARITENQCAAVQCDRPADSRMRACRPPV
jgi:hypothetical protein